MPIRRANHAQTVFTKSANSAPPPLVLDDGGTEPIESVFAKALQGGGEIAAPSPDEALVIEIAKGLAIFRDEYGRDPRRIGANAADFADSEWWSFLTKAVRLRSGLDDPHSYYDPDYPDDYGPEYGYDGPPEPSPAGSNLLRKSRNPESKSAKRLTALNAIDRAYAGHLGDIPQALRRLAASDPDKVIAAGGELPSSQHARGDSDPVNVNPRNY